MRISEFFNLNKTHPIGWRRLMRTRWLYFSFLSSVEVRIIFLLLAGLVSFKSGFVSSKSWSRIDVVQSNGIAIYLESRRFIIDRTMAYFRCSHEFQSNSSHVPNISNLWEFYMKTKFLVLNFLAADKFEKFKNKKL